MNTVHLYLLRIQNCSFCSTRFEAEIRTVLSAQAGYELTDAVHFTKYKRDYHNHYYLMLRQTNTYGSNLFDHQVTLTSARNSHSEIRITISIIGLWFLLFIRFPKIRFNRGPTLANIKIYQIIFMKCILSDIKYESHHLIILCKSSLLYHLLEFFGIFQSLAYKNFLTN